jgi:hypothetical protein
MLLRNKFYKHSAPPALQNQGVCQWYHSSPLSFLETESGADSRRSIRWRAPLENHFNVKICQRYFAIVIDHIFKAVRQPQSAPIAQNTARR